MLLVGLIVGGGVAYAATRSSGARGSGTAEVRVNGNPVNAGTLATVAVARQLAPAVGTIVATQSATSDLGSGFVIAHDSAVSYLVTNNHVVSGAVGLHVEMPDGQEFVAKLVGADSLDDIAVVSVPSTTLPQATFGTSANLTVGQPVIAIGSPLGNQGSVTSGVISALHRTISAGDTGGTSSETLEDVLQTDASINPGNSGGPLADMQGRIIGINVAVAGNTSRIGFSIPSDVAQNVAQSLIAHQAVKHPFLGISYLTAIDATESGQPYTGPGVLVTKVVDGTPAASAGFHTGDVLMAVNGTTIDNGQTLGGLIQQYHVGDSVAFTVRRGSDTMKLQATLTERPKGQ